MGYWYEEAVFYSIYALSQCGAPFQNEYLSNCNRLWEIEKWIPQMKSLGCNALLLSPVFKSKTHGYDTTDYFHIDNRIGENEGFKDLVSKFHSEGIKVVLDGVFNHCGRDFAAFRDVCEKREGSAFKNWISGINFQRNNALNDGFSYDSWNGYLELVKLNLKNPEVVKHLLDAAKYWTAEFDIDGLRLDCADILDFGFMKLLREQAEKLKPDFWLMGEVVHGDYNKWANPNALHSATNYEMFKSLHSSHNDRNLYELAHTLDREFGPGGLYREKYLYNFAENHDQNRLASMVEIPAYLYTIYMLLFTIPGIPSIYYGGEWGIRGKRENGSDAGIRPCIELESAHRDEPELEGVIKHLAEIRKSSQALMHGSYRQVFLEYGKPFAFERSFGDETVIIAVNPTKNPAEINLGKRGATFMDLMNNEAVAANWQGNLPVSPHWGRILRACP
ncbi:MAG: alpha-glucosidase C-terminal domain-containing protein [Clostridiales bacterium]|jgi:glycosidase|nr:alpha-glucosidase C-terminal domain-containing protein [Clostridiales bacterium]